MAPHVTPTFVTSLPTRPSALRVLLAPGGATDALCPAQPLSLSPLQGRRARAMAPMTMGLFGLGVPELIVIAGVGIFIFGPGKIAEMGKDLGGIAGGVKKATSEFKDAMQDSLEEADRDIEAKRVEKENADKKPVVEQTIAETPVAVAEVVATEAKATEVKATEVKATEVKATEVIATEEKQA